MEYFYPLIMGVALSLAIIPVMVRLAPALGMMDRPNERKVHGTPIPRVGGWGIVLGALIPIVLSLPMDRLMYLYIFGALVLLVFGSLDDRLEMGHYMKFVGQLLAVIPLVIFGDFYVSHIPILNIDMGPVLGMPFTIVAMVGVINALNHSDGLDGLASGEAMLSLGAMLYLAYLEGAGGTVIFILAIIGGLLGFLRYNSHPATVFMGDSGSQFIGFTLAFLAIWLIQGVNPSFSPAVVLLLLGLPVADILVVLKKRATGGSNLFLATKNHVHHRLLNLGFVHQESVVLIYSVQTLCVLAGVILRYQPDWLIVMVYLGICALVFFGLTFAESQGWRASGNTKVTAFGQAVSYFRRRLLVVAPRKFLDFALPAFLVAGALSVREVPFDFGVMACIVVVLMLILPWIEEGPRSLLHRGLIYIAATFVIYLQLYYPAWSNLEPWIDHARLAFFVLVGLSVLVAVRFSPRRRKYEFEPTGTDYLMVVAIFVTITYTTLGQTGATFAHLILELVTVLYACELILIEKRNRWNTLTLGALISAGILAVRALF